MDQQHNAHRKCFVAAVNTFHMGSFQIISFLHTDKEFGCGKQINVFGMG